MENYDEMLRAMGFFTFKYGKIDWVESNNEYWLEQDARLRTDFNITTGIKSAEIEKFKRKSVMKTYYQKAGIRPLVCDGRCNGGPGFRQNCRLARHCQAR